MFRNLKLSHFAPFALLAIAIAGCSEKVETTKPSPLALAEPEAIADPVGGDTSTDEEKKTSPAEKIANAYVPPYPDRINPFKPPMTPRLQIGKNQREKNSSVTLVGFANVSEPKVVLAIDGVVSPMSNGEKIAGVQVISISPPNAVLQRGRTRWTASLAN